MPVWEFEPSGFLQLHVQIASPGRKAFDVVLIRLLHADPVMRRETVNFTETWLKPEEEKKKEQSGLVLREQSMCIACCPRFVYSLLVSSIFSLTQKQM